VSPSRRWILLALPVLACSGAPSGEPVLDRLQDTDLACVEQPVVREESAGCATATGGLVVSGHADRAQAEEAVALHLGDGAAGRVVDGGSWTLLADAPAVADRAAALLDGSVVTSLEQVTGGCPTEGARLDRLRDALGDPDWC
jgi:hypothetical protein